MMTLTMVTAAEARSRARRPAPKAIGLARVALIVAHSLSAASASGASQYAGGCSASIVSASPNRTAAWADVPIDVVIAGLPKCGTTYIRNMLAAHTQLACPSVALGEQSRCKEDTHGVPLWQHSAPADFARRVCATARGPGDGAARRVVVGDPSLLLRPGLPASLAQLPSVRTVVCIREPIEWLVSARNHALREVRGNHLALAPAWRALGGCPANHTPAFPPSLADLAIGCKWHWIHRKNYDRLPHQLGGLAADRTVVLSLEANEHDQVGAWVRLTRWLGLRDARALAEQAYPVGKAKPRKTAAWVQSWCADVGPHVRAAVHGHYERSYSALLGFVRKRLPHSILSPSQVAGTARVTTC